MYQNPFHENMSRQESREALFRELKKVTDIDRLARLEADYVAVLPTIVRREISEAWNDLESKSM